MDPLTLIGAALLADATAAPKGVASQAVNDAYNGLKALIERKFAGNPEAEMVLTQYEQDPDVWTKPMIQKLDQTGAAQDPEIQKAAQQLLDQLKAQPGGAHYVQTAIGNYNAQAQQVRGKEHPDTAESLNNLGSLLYRQGDYTAAKPYLEQALAICEQVLGKDHPFTRRVRSNLQSLDEREQNQHPSHG